MLQTASGSADRASQLRHEGQGGLWQPLRGTTSLERRTSSTTATTPKRWGHLRPWPGDPPVLAPDRPGDYRARTNLSVKIRANILTEGSIRDLVKVVDEEMDGVAREQRKTLRTIETELADVRRRLDTIYNLVETTPVDMADFTPRIRQHRDRQERLEYSAEQARAALAQRRKVFDDVNTIAAYAKDMRDFLNESELTERRAFIKSFVKEIVVMPDDALLRYTIPISQSTTKTEVLMDGGLGCRWEWWNWSWRLIP